MASKMSDVVLQTEDKVVPAEMQVLKDDRKVKTETEVLGLGCVTPDCRVIVGKENGGKIEIKKETSSPKPERKRRVSGCESESAELKELRLRIEKLELALGSVRTDYGSIAQEVLKLRRNSELFEQHLQVCVSHQDEVVDSEVLTSGSKCWICFEPATQENLTKLDPCGHTFHTDCMDWWFKQELDCQLDLSFEEKRDCPFCRDYVILNCE